MPSDTKKVVIVGVTGKTGEPIAQALVKSGKFAVTGTVRPASLTKPAVKELQAIGVSIVALDWHTAPASELEALFAGADTVISACNWEVIPDQTRLVDAAKVAGVKRFVPCDWGTICPPGVMKLEDMKRAIHDYIFKTGVPYTIIAVGYWYEITFPPPPPYGPGSPGYEFFGDKVYSSYGSGNIRCASVNRKHIGNIVARIIDDPETIGKKVLANEDEVSVDEVWALAEKYAPGKMAPLRTKVSDGEVDKYIREGEGTITEFFYQYMKSVYIHGHNSEAAAKQSGWIIARERYPDLKLQKAEEWAKERYTSA